MKLFKLSARDSLLPLAVDNGGKVIFQDGSDIPLMYWPNGACCFEANLYIGDLVLQGVAKSSLSQYAYDISHIIRYCFNNRIPLHELTDVEFIFFITSLKGQKIRASEDDFKRENKTVRAIGRRTLHFLESVGRVHGIAQMVGIEGQIKVFYKKSTSKAGSNSITTYTASHVSFPVGGRDRKTKPILIAKDIIRQLNLSVPKSTSNIFIAARRRLLIRLLEITGGRRSEIAKLTVSSLRPALNGQCAYLVLQTSKRRDSFREISVSHIDYLFIRQYIDINLLLIGAKLEIDITTDTPLMLSVTKQEALAHNTVTQELSQIATAGDVVLKSHPHLFRHRFITKQFVRLLQHYKIVHKDDFWSRWRIDDDLKQAVQEVAGHARKESLDIYLDLANAEFSQLCEVREAVQYQEELTSMRHHAELLLDDIKNGISEDEIYLRVQALSSLGQGPIVSH